MEDIIIKIGKLIKEKRQEKGYTTQELAELLDVSAGLINNIENAKTDTFNLSLIQKLSTTLGIDLVLLLANKVEHISDLINISQNIPERLSTEANMLLKEFIRAAIALNYNNKKIETLLNKLIYEINFMADIEK